ncbi:MAG: hypothetical protein KatS3mg052_2469 [Candidatus Roseilinea sp.]|nr:MAG: hypothetical protein KatS3mg052_2469 [Candidatus Roseilinea sp.]
MSPAPARFLIYPPEELIAAAWDARPTSFAILSRTSGRTGRPLGVDLRTAFIVDNRQPGPMDAAERAALLRTLFKVSGD